MVWFVNSDNFNTDITDGFDNVVHVIYFNVF